MKFSAILSLLTLVVCVPAFGRQAECKDPGPRGVVTCPSDVGAFCTAHGSHFTGGCSDAKTEAGFLEDIAEAAGKDLEEMFRGMSAEERHRGFSEGKYEIDGAVVTFSLPRSLQGSQSPGGRAFDSSGNSGDGPPEELFGCELCMSLDGFSPLSCSDIGSGNREELIAKAKAMLKESVGSNPGISAKLICDGGVEVPIPLAAPNAVPPDSRPLEEQDWKSGGP